MKVAQNFEACRSVYDGEENPEIQETTLQCAIDHVVAREHAFASLETITKRLYIANDAEVLFAKIRADFWGRRKDGSIILTKSELTGKYATTAGAAWA